jgi:type IV secretory pathway VirJ component
MISAVPVIEPWRLLRAALIVLALTSCTRAVSTQIIDAGRFGQVRVFRPSGAPRGVVFLFSDSTGWSDQWSRVAQSLRAQRAAVIGVDLPSYLANIRKSGDGCHYLVSEIEDFSKRIQHDLGSQEYFSPVLAGLGEGATLAYAALAQAPAATVAGAVVVDPEAVLQTRVALCPGAPSQAATGGGFSYRARAGLPGFLRVSSRGASPPEFAPIAEIEPVLADAAPPLDRLAVAVSAALAAGHATKGSLHDLPLVEVPTVGSGRCMAVIYSGDGGWRDIDKTLGEILAREGTPVVGVDSLRYFWRAKTPERVAADLAAIIGHYGDLWGRDRVALIGYSFGAVILPFAINRLPAADKARVVQISLLGLEARATFEFKMSGWLSQVGVGADPYAKGPLVLPELLRIDLARVQCVYGDEEADSLCRTPELAGAEIIRTGGGHHFDGDYAALAQRILDGLRRRAGNSGGRE